MDLGGVFGLAGFSHRPLALWIAGHVLVWVCVFVLGVGSVADTMAGMVILHSGLNCLQWSVWSCMDLALMVGFAIWFLSWVGIRSGCQRRLSRGQFFGHAEIHESAMKKLRSVVNFGFGFSLDQDHARGDFVKSEGGWNWTCTTTRELPGHKWSAVHCRGGFLWIVWVVVWGGLCRIGEAAHPGPNAVDTHWTFGIANPSGLNSKVDLCAHQDGQVWVYSETHLSKQGFVKFRKGMQALKSPYKYLVPGHPCPVRRHGEAGVHSGVLMASSFPARPLPHSFDKDLYATGRLQVAGVMVGGAWVQVGMLYGFPCNGTHTHARYQTETCLAELVDRVAGQAQGPRIVCGDFNYAGHELSQLQRLADCGFREVQDLRAWQMGVSVESTGRGSKRIDQVWISPELQAGLQQVEVCWDRWADHATVEITFAQASLDRFSQSWFMPSAFPRPKEWQCNATFETQSDPTQAYAELWRTIENQARCWNAQHGVYVSRAQCGRAQALEVRRKRVVVQPPKTAREGELEPGFYGTSLQHARFFKQLRRLQALTQLLTKGIQSPSAAENARDTWRAIRTAVGFPGGFGLWWFQNGLPPVFSSILPQFLPDCTLVRQLFDGFHGFVKAYEVRLAQTRYQFGKAKRAGDLNMVFRDCKESPPPVVDTLLDRIEAQVEEVRSEDLSLVLVSPVDFLPGLPVVVAGRVVEVLAHAHDQVWVSHVDGIEPGATLTQERVVMSDMDILARFRGVWEPRWNKMSHVVPGQWEQICNFMDRVLPAVTWTFEPWTSDRFVEVVNQKNVRQLRDQMGCHSLTLQLCQLLRVKPW